MFESTARTRASLAIALGIAMCPVFGASGQTVEADCASVTVAGLTPAQLGAWKGLTPAAMQLRFKAMTDAGLFSPVLDSLVRIFLVPGNGGATNPMDGLGTGAVTLLRAELDSARAELSGGEALRLLGAVTVRRFDIATRLGRSPYTLFDGRGAAITLDPLPSDTRRSVCWLAMSMSDLLTKFGAPGREKLASALDERVKRWDNFAGHGYSMLPYELLVNAWIPRGSLEPPRVQLILAHPSAAAQMTGEALKSLAKFSRSNVLALEPIGLLGYTHDNSWYGGVSWVLTFPSSSEVGAGNGVMVHVGRFGQGGYVWRPKATNGASRNAWVLSLDLYGYLIKAAGCRTSLSNTAPADFVAKAQQCLAPK